MSWRVEKHLIVNNQLCSIKYMSNWVLASSLNGLCIVSEYIWNMTDIIMIYMTFLSRNYAWCRDNCKDIICIQNGFSKYVSTISKSWSEWSTFAAPLAKGYFKKNNIAFLYMKWFLFLRVFSPQLITHSF